MHYHAAYTRYSLEVQSTTNEMLLGSPILAGFPVLPMGKAVELDLFGWMFKRCWITKRFRYLKCRNPHLYKLYG